MVKKTYKPIMMPNGNGLNNTTHNHNKYKMVQPKSVIKPIRKVANKPLVTQNNTSDNTKSIINNVTVTPQNPTTNHKPIITEPVQQPVQQTQPVQQPEPVKQIPTVQEPPVVHPELATSFYNTENNFHVLGASVRGSSHITSNDPCQDFCIYKSIAPNWGVAVTADGAGSCKLSHKGSMGNCNKAAKFIANQINTLKWPDTNYIPSELEWNMLVIHTLNKIVKDSEKYAESHNLSLSQLSATIIINVHTPFGLLVAHVGDGRAGYLNGDNKWVASITPHKGEESNQTVFVQSNAHAKPMFKMSDVYVPETKVIIDDVKAFVAMSDGCEKATWLCSLFENDMFTDPNKPYEPFFNGLVNYLKTDKEANHLEDFI
ncbi:MAG: PP2C family serine/threonine-protein phosphatase, partial [Bacteroidales bacterium]